jgi:hypothetical protein
MELPRVGHGFNLEFTGQPNDIESLCENYRPVTAEWQSDLLMLA